MRRSQAAWLAVLAVVSMSGPARGQMPLVRLERWAGRAALVPNRGPGIEEYVLVAEVNWKKSAPRGAEHYRVRVTLPDGQETQQGLDPEEGPPAHRLSVLVPESAVRNLIPAAVVIRAVVVDATSGAPLSDVLVATIDDFPNPGVSPTEGDDRPFGWGRPLGADRRRLSRPGPDDLSFVRIPAAGDQPGFFLATAEASNQQVAARLPKYDPKAGRSDEFALEDPGQPAVGLSPNLAKSYLESLSKADPAGITFRLPTRAEWLRAARAGKDSAFWWGDEPTHPEGANFLGPEPGLMPDTTAPTVPANDPPEFQANPWGLYHTFGNVAEWATGPNDQFIRLGGHFRTEPASPLPEPAVDDPATTGADPYVGVRPAFSLTPDDGAKLVRKALAADKALSGIRVAFDPDRASAILDGEVPDVATRRRADRATADLWFLASVENRLTTPTLAAGRLAKIGPVAGPARRLMPLGRPFDEVPLAASWAEQLPVEGSEWWVNFYLPNGGHFAHVLPGRRAGVKQVLAVLDMSKLAAAGLRNANGVRVALSLGASAPDPADPRIVSNVFTFTPKTP